MLISLDPSGRVQAMSPAALETQTLGKLASMAGAVGYSQTIERDAGSPLTKWHSSGMSARAKSAAVEAIDCEPSLNIVFKVDLGTHSSMEQHLLEKLYMADKQ